MKVLTEDAVVICNHVLGTVKNRPSQSWVTIAGRKVLVAIDPENRSISGCPNIGVTIKPCTTTLKVDVGYSQWIRIDGKSICLDTVTGLTDGTPPGTVKYTVRDPGQKFVTEGA